MSSTSNTPIDVTGSRDASLSLLQMHKRHSAASSETGESSTTASKRGSITKSSLTDGILDGVGFEDNTSGVTEVDRSVKHGRGSHRSHKSRNSRNSGSFLLSNPIFQPPSGSPASPGTGEHSQQRSVPRDNKGKGAFGFQDRRHSKKRSDVEPSIGGSPLAANVANANAGSDLGEVRGLGGDSNMNNHEGTNIPRSRAKATATGLDFDAAQIVNLALNLSESRRNATKRNISTPLPPSTGGVGEGFAGGSLRQHLQQQRRASRNISPKPDRSDRATTSSPRLTSNQRMGSPLQVGFDSHPDGSLQYHFSPSTLARAEKAKTAIELMVQYRRLLQYVPPLKPQALERITTASSMGSALGSPLSSTFSTSRTISKSMTAMRHVGREYNPLQYIRNRKVRARERKTIDGESQGFGELAKVSAWVDQVSQEASFENGQDANYVFLPPFSNMADVGSSPSNLPQSVAGKSQPTVAKAKRPRIDWVINPADMLAEVFWLEQEDNKKIIEDPLGRRIFPQKTERRRPELFRSEEVDLQKPPEPTSGMDDTDPYHRIDTRLPEFRSIKSDLEGDSDNGISRARQSVGSVMGISHSRNGSIRGHHTSRQALSNSGSDSSETEAVRRITRARSETADSHDRGKDILEKQMIEMLAKEARENEWRGQTDSKARALQHVEDRNPMHKGVVDKPAGGWHSRSTSKDMSNEYLSRRGSPKNGSSGRASLEVPGGHPRGSLDGLDLTAPNSPQTEATKASNSLIPSISMDLSPPLTALSRVRSRINPFRDHSRDPNRARPVDETPVSGQYVSSAEQTPESPVSLEHRRRSLSPVKRIMSKRDDEQKPNKKAGSIRKGKSGEESSGIRGLFKGNRGAVARASDFLWKKEASPGLGTSSSLSTDESDGEEVAATQDKLKSDNISPRDSSAALPTEKMDGKFVEDESSTYFNDLPTFRSSFELRGRPMRTRGDDDLDSLTGRQHAWKDRRRPIHIPLMEPPRIDIQTASPPSSPDLPAIDRYSDVSELESRRGSFSNGVQTADARLNAILGLPEGRFDTLPVTGLSHLETSHENRPVLDGKRHWSISDRGVSIRRGPMSKREIARVRALLLSSGIKAKEISRRAAEIKDISKSDEKLYSEVALLAQEPISLVPKSKEHLVAARIITNDIHISSNLWRTSADLFTGTTVESLLDRVEALQTRVVDQLTPMARKAADEADDVIKDLLTEKTLAVKRLAEMMHTMMRRRRRRFRWLRRGGWMMLEWVLVSIMWFLWFMVVIARVLMGFGTGVVAVVRWLLWM